MPPRSGGTQLAALESSAPLGHPVPGHLGIQGRPWHDPRMRFLRENWLWIAAPVVLFLLLVFGLNLLEETEPVYPLR